MGLGFLLCSPQSPEPVRVLQRWGNRAASPRPRDPVWLGGWGPQGRPMGQRHLGVTVQVLSPWVGGQQGTSAQRVTLGPVNPKFASRLKSFHQGP